MKTCEEPDCTNAAVVGWGIPAMHLCIPHLKERIQGVRQTVDHAQQICDESMLQTPKRGL